MKNWYKTLTLENHDVLFIKAYKEEDDSYRIIIQIKHDGMDLKSSLCFKEELKRDFTWDNWPQDNGEKWAKNLIKFVEDSEIYDEKKRMADE